MILKQPPLYLSKLVRLPSAADMSILPVIMFMIFKNNYKWHSSQWGGGTVRSSPYHGPLMARGGAVFINSLCERCWLHTIPGGPSHLIIHNTSAEN